MTMGYIAVAWDYWLSVGLAIAALIMVVAIVGGYVTQVQRRKYPKPRD